MPRMSPKRLELEITESVLLEAKNVETVLQRLGSIGVSVALDDFGTGYASLAYLRQLLFKKLKIDKSFCTGHADLRRQREHRQDRAGPGAAPQPDHRGRGHRD